MDTAHLADEIEGVFDLQNPVLHNSARISASGPFFVHTDSKRWSYAVAFRFNTERLTDDPAFAYIIRVDTLVRTGRIGVLLVGDDLVTILSTVEERSHLDGRGIVELLVKNRPESGWLVLRNNALTGIESECEISSIQLFRTSEIAPEAGNLADVLFSDGTIDLTKLETVLYQTKKSTALQRNIFDTLRQKWSEIPAGLDHRCRTADIASMPDTELQGYWTRIHRETTTGPGFAVRGWYQELYKDVLRGKRVLDVGSGMGIDGIPFALSGARVTFLDIVQTNLALLERLCGIFGVVGAKFHFLEDFSSFEALSGEFDVIWCQGSMINAPFAFAQREAKLLLQHLPIGGRWIELTYPRERWEREGRLPFDQWGNITDGEGTPWMEWYDLARLRARLLPAEFTTVLYFNFHNNDFNWFDLVRTK